MAEVTQSRGKGWTGLCGPWGAPAHQGLQLPGGPDCCMATTDQLWTQLSITPQLGGKFQKSESRGTGQEAACSGHGAVARQAGGDLEDLTGGLTEERIG